MTDELSEPSKSSETKLPFDLPVIESSNPQDADEYVEEDQDQEAGECSTSNEQSTIGVQPSVSSSNHESSASTKVSSQSKMSWGSVNPYADQIKAQLQKQSESSDAQKPSTSKPQAEKQKTDLAEITLDDDHLGGAVCVFYTNSPFSDFAPFPFIVDGRYYYTLEHYFQIQMLYAFGLFKLASECIRIPDAVEFRSALKKGLRQLIKEELFEESTFTKWKANNTYRVLRRGNKAKFEQNYQLRQILMHTDERLLIFANSKDRLLGVGMTEAEFLVWSQKNNLYLEDLIEIWCARVRRPKDLGQNILGLTLMEVRSEIIRKPSVIAEWKHTNKDLGLPPLIKRFESLTADDKKKIEKIQEIISSNAQHPDNLLPLPIKPKQPEKKATKKCTRWDTELVDPTDTALAMGRWFDEKPYTPPSHRSHDQDQPSSATRSEEYRKRAEQMGKQTGNEKDVGGDKSDESKENDPKQNKPATDDDPETIDTTELQTQITTTVIADDDEELEENDKVVVVKTADEWKEVAEKTAERSKNVGASQPDSWKKREREAERNASYHPDSVIGRLKKLTDERTMINPYTVVDNGVQLPDDNETQAAKEARWQREQEAAAVEAMSIREPTYMRPPGSIYNLEPGEICPPGVVAPPPGIEEPAILLPVRMRPGTHFITEMQEYNANPAALPPELLPLPQMPNDWSDHPYLWRQRFPGAPRRLPRYDCPLHIDKYPLWADRPRLIEAPSKDPDATKKVWAPSKNPVADALNHAKNYMETVKRMLKQNKSAQHEEGADPTAIRRRQRRKRRHSAGDTENSNIDPGTAADTSMTDDDLLLARFLAKKASSQPSWLQLQLMGFIPPPIAGNPLAQSRNVKIKAQTGAVRFATREAALRHAGNRWCKQGKLGSTGKYLDLPDEFEEEDDDEPVDYSATLDDPDDGSFYPPRPKKPVETHIIYVDTSRYEPYVRWYQRNHGYVPLPDDDMYRHHEHLRAFYQSYQANIDMLMYEPTEAEEFFGEEESMKGIDQLFGQKAWGEYFALRRMKWADWERRVDRGNQAHVIDLAQKVEVKDEGASVAGQPLKYELVDLAEEDDEIVTQPLNRPVKTSESAEHQEQLDEPIVVAHTNRDADSIADLVFGGLQIPKTEVIIS